MEQGGRTGFSSAGLGGAQACVVEPVQPVLHVTGGKSKPGGVGEVGFSNHVGDEDRAA